MNLKECNKKTYERRIKLQPVHLRLLLEKSKKNNRCFADGYYK